MTQSKTSVETITVEPSKHEVYGTVWRIYENTRRVEAFCTRPQAEAFAVAMRQGKEYPVCVNAALQSSPSQVTQ